MKQASCLCHELRIPVPAFNIRQRRAQALCGTVGKMIELTPVDNHPPELPAVFQRCPYLKTGLVITTFEQTHGLPYWDDNTALQTQGSES